MSTSKKAAGVAAATTLSNPGIIRIGLHEFLQWKDSNAHLWRGLPQDYESYLFGSKEVSAEIASKKVVLEGAYEAEQASREMHLALAILEDSPVPEDADLARNCRVDITMAKNRIVAFDLTEHAKTTRALHNKDAREWKEQTKSSSKCSASQSTTGANSAVGWAVSRTSTHDLQNHIGPVVADSAHVADYSWEDDLPPDQAKFSPQWEQGTIQGHTPSAPPMSTVAVIPTGPPTTRVDEQFAPTRVSHH